MENRVSLQHPRPHRGQGFALSCRDSVTALCFLFNVKVGAGWERTSMSKYGHFWHVHGRSCFAGCQAGQSSPCDRPLSLLESRC